MEIAMLSNHDAIATLAVRDLARAREFYEGKLGLEVDAVDDNSGVARYRTGKTLLLVYKSEHAGSNQATGVNFAVGREVDAIAKALAAKGVPFERYPESGVPMEGDVHIWGDFRTAWFQDPDGNILSLVSD
jgi:catechol 2,3-dioxygenase-like lactoylglutathione lyase family enzyme